ncbi:histone deacetylase 11 isoform X1 [Octopus sinensis]|uniref:Histone deacetylase 11 n=1 Tax=Octopus sinensis TaxID=2607531 RepID=A0A6P7SA63_9MOLL|nr:histone deacetylase 11 isoform X1 [Octopus sinensis]
MEENDETQRRINNSKLFIEIPDYKWPIIYSSHYNISFMYFEKLHPFDAGKWGKIHKFLKDEKFLQDDTTVEPIEASEDDLLVIHPQKYLKSLKLHTILEGLIETGLNVARIVEIPPVAIMPNFLVQRYVLQPFRYQTGGTILAGELALKRGWSINLGGGFHHCSAKKGGGFCAYADITLTMKFMRDRHKIRKILIVDLDAHQGNGYQRDVLEADDNDVYILDIYNRKIYPFDGYAKKAIKRKVELEPFTADEEYLNSVSVNVHGALNEFAADVVIYNAGTDILDGDPLGNLAISPAGVIKRDYIVFEAVRSRNIPIIMLTSGGYMRNNARIIANSILNLHQNQLIDCKEARHHQALETPSMPPPDQVPRSRSESFISRFFCTEPKKSPSMESHIDQSKS